MGDTGLPWPSGDGGDGGTNSPGGGDSLYVIPTNGLFMQIGGITNGVISLSINNATNFVYEIFSTETATLSEGLTNWNIEQAVFPTNTSMPFTVAELDRTNNLVFYSRDWTGVVSDGNMITPEWWLFYYFGTIDVSETNMDASGNNTLLNDYNNSIDPNIISFSLNVANRYFNTSSATIQISVSAGVPSYMAALVDSTTFSAATWTPYSSNFVFNLGGVEGWHSVWVGLKGLPPDA